MRDILFLEFVFVCVYAAVQIPSQYFIVYVGLSSIYTHEGLCVTHSCDLTTCLQHSWVRTTHHNTCQLSITEFLWAYVSVCGS